MNSTTSDGNATEVTMGLVGDTHGSLYKIIGVTLAIASGKLIRFTRKKKKLLNVILMSGEFILFRHIYWQ